jgi:hypothetical protein
MNLGFVGVGKWAQKLAESFRRCGAEIVACDRALWHEAPGPGFGTLMHWREQIDSRAIDAMVVAAPPSVTTEVALACAAARKPVLATKPLFDHPKSIRAPFYVDFWRLWANEHDWMKREDHKDRARYALLGHGPFRDFPGGLDWGPHVVAALLDAGYTRLVEAFRLNLGGPEGSECFQVQMADTEGRLAIGQFGNGSVNSVRVVWGEEEDASYIGGQPKETILRSFCQDFLNDISEGFVDTRLLNLSRETMRILNQVRETAFLR